MEIQIKTPKRMFRIQEGKPVIVQWKAKNKSRSGLGMALGWIRRGDDPHTIRIVIPRSRPGTSWNPNIRRPGPFGNRKSSTSEF